MYQPLTIKPSGSRINQALTFMAPRGENLRDLPQAMDASMALKIVNYLITSNGQLEKRKGLLRLFTVAGTTGITMLKKYTDDVYIFGYATTVAAYRISTGAVTNIKADFLANNGFEGTRYGDYFYVCNGVERIWRISQTLAYDAQTANFNLGATLTGGTSGATAIILQDVDAGATGTLTLGAITGTFQNNELITDNGAVPGSADVNGTVAFAITEIATSPRRTQAIAAINSRLFAGTSDSVQYSAIDTGTNPPFTDWAVSTLATGAGRVDNRRAGTVRSIVDLADFILVFADEGKYAFKIDTIDSAGTLSKIDTPIMSRLDFGGARGAISTPKGVFYANERGLWQLTAIGQADVPFSDQERIITKLLTTNFFDDLTLTNMDLVFDSKRETVFMTCARNSTINNFVLWANVETGAIGEFSGWNLNRFLQDGIHTYGVDSRNRQAYECFEGFSDDGNDIGTEYLQELNTGGLETRKFLMGLYVQGFLSASTSLTVRFDIFDVQGRPITDKLRFTWTSQYNLNGADGYSNARYASSSYGGDEDFANTIESFDGIRPFIRNYQRIRVHITGGDELPHIISWIKIISKEKVQIRRRRLVQLT